MAASYVTYPGNGSQTDFTFPFAYLDQLDVVVLVSDAPTAFTFLNSSAIRVSPAPALGSTVRIQRITLATSGLVDFTDGSNLLEVDLDTLALRDRYVGEEAVDQAAEVRSLALRGTTGESLPALVPAELRKGHLLAFNDNTGMPEMSSFTRTELANLLAAVYSASAGPLDALSFLPAGVGAISRSAQDKMRETVSVEDFGAVGDATCTTGTDDSAAFQRAIDAVYASGGGCICAFGRYRIGTNVTVKPGVCLVGNWRNVPGEMPNESDPWSALFSTLFISPTATFTFKDSSGISGFVALQFGLVLPFVDAATATAGIAAFAGTAFTVGGQDVSLSYLFALGFNFAVLSSGFERIRCDYVTGDCNNGIRITTSPDVSYVTKCHFWPFTTAHQVWTTNALMRRPGEGFSFFGINDWLRITDCFCYGYLHAYHVTDGSAITFVSCSADNTSSGGVGDYPGSVAFLVDGNSGEIRFIGCNCAAQTDGFLISVSAGDRVEIVSCAIGACSAAAMYVAGGNVRFVGGSIDLCPIGLVVDSPTARVFVNEVSFKRCSTAPVYFNVANSTTFLGNHNDFEDGATTSTVVSGLTNWKTQTIASAATLALTVAGEDFTVTGATGISAVNGAWTGREVTLYFTASLTVTSSAAGTLSSVRLNSNTNMTTANGSVLKLRHNGVQWFEVGRSA